MQRSIAILIRDYQWIHIVLGLAGNVCFFVGSVFFLYESLKLPGTWLFIAGSAGMLIGAAGQAAVKLVWARSPRARRLVEQYS